jgi:hypothetical protein
MTAQVVTITESSNSQVGMNKIKWAWTTDSVGGAIVASTTAGEVNTTTGRYSGAVVRCVTDPVDGPTASYDITIVDEDGADVLLGYGADRHTTNTEDALGPFACIYDTKLSLLIANAGNSKSGYVYLYIAKL